jgi:hypothetical protein
MAYSATVTKTKLNNVDYVYDITEDWDGTTPGTATDFSIAVPAAGRILRYKSNATSSASHTVTPVISVVENATSGVNIVMQVSAAGNDIDEQAVDPPKYYSSTKLLYINNNSNHADAEVTTRIFLRDTWGL